MADTSVAVQPAPTQKLELADAQVLRQELDLTDPASLHADANADPQLAEQANDTVARMLEVNPSDAGAREKMKASVEAMGVQLQKEAARRSALLKQPIAQLMKVGGEGGPVATSLIDLKVQIETLDPAKFDLEPGWFARTLGYIPGVGTPLKRYFSKYESASTTIDAIVNSLKQGQEQLKRDNITLAEDQKAMRALTHKLEQAIKLGQLIDQKLQDALATDVLQSDPRHAFVTEELQFPLRQRIQDLQQQLLVNQQGFLTTEMVIRNNKELIRGTNRALNVTLSALQVAVTLALALANQKIVLQKVQAVTKTTEQLIADTAARLKTQGADIQRQASDTMLDIGVLKTAFADIKSALDDISRYRQEALPKMAQNIVEMDRLAAESETLILKVERAERVAQAFPIEIVD